MRAVIAGYKRSPFQIATRGQFADTRPDDLLKDVVLSLIESTGIPPEEIEDILAGCSFPEGEQGQNIARMVVLLAGLPKSIAGCTINRFCASSLQAVIDASNAINSGQSECIIAAGIESMSRIPMGGFAFMPHEKMFEEHPEYFISMGETAENVATQYGISRIDTEEFALKSHQKAAEAQTDGRLTDEIVPITTSSGVIDKDGGIRGDSTLEKMATLSPAFKENGIVTAATSSPMTDGAAGVLVCSEEFAAKHGLNIMAHIEGFAVHGNEPETMGLGPIKATQKVFGKLNITMDDIDIVELHEAFAAQAIAVIQELNIDTDKMNLDGGALAMGHPLGASGARVAGKAASLLQRENKKRALVTMCVGAGQGVAMVLNRKGA